MMKNKLVVLGVDREVRVVLDKTKRQKIIQELLSFMEKYDCFDSESFQQGDDSLYGSVEMVSNMLDIAKARTKYIS
jgi:hypothetical protein